MFHKPPLTLSADQTSRQVRNTDDSLTYTLALEPAGQPAPGHHRPPCSQQGTSDSPRELAATTSQEQKRSSSFRHRFVHKSCEIVIYRDKRQKLKYLLKGLRRSLLAAFLGGLILGVQLHCYKPHFLHEACSLATGRSGVAENLPSSRAKATNRAQQTTVSLQYLFFHQA